MGVGNLGPHINSVAKVFFLLQGWVRLWLVLTLDYKLCHNPLTDMALDLACGIGSGCFNNVDHAC